MSQKFKDYENEEKQENDFDVGFKIPDTKSVLASLQESLQKAHAIETEEDDKQGRPKKQKRGGAICCCGGTNCRIGPFTERN